MSLIPAFGIGVWNAWIFMLVYAALQVALPMLRMLINKYGSKHTPKPTAPLPYTKTEKRIELSTYTILGLLLIYSVFLPLKLHMPWLYLGLAIFLLGMVTAQSAGLSWRDRTAVNQPVTRGIYRFSRHPMYLGMMLQMLGTGIAAASWIFLLLAIVLIMFLNILATPEERYCLQNYGNAYREYMNRTPRWIGIPKPETN